MMMKIQVNNKALSKEKRDKLKKNKQMKSKFNSVEDLMEYVIMLEQRLEKLESKLK